MYFDAHKGGAFTRTTRHVAYAINRHDASRVALPSSVRVMWTPPGAARLDRHKQQEAKASPASTRGTTGVESWYILMHSANLCRETRVMSRVAR